MRRTTKKLTLQRETLRQLGTGDLRRVAGGNSYPDLCAYTDTCVGCIPWRGANNGDKKSDPTTHC
jgi:hypothetical protein